MTQFCKYQIKMYYNIQKISTYRYLLTKKELSYHFLLLMLLVCLLLVLQDKIHVPKFLTFWIFVSVWIPRNYNNANRSQWLALRSQRRDEIPGSSSGSRRTEARGRSAGHQGAEFVNVTSFYLESRTAHSKRMLFFYNRWPNFAFFERQEYTVKTWLF